jgi:hypothetical protein
MSAMRKVYYIEDAIGGEYLDINDEWTADRDDALEFTSYEEALDEAERAGGLVIPVLRHR